MEAYRLLESRWAGWNGLDPAGMVACASGSSALWLALEALELPPGGEVVTGDFSMVAVPRAITLAGLTPVFVDCDDRLLVAPKLVDRFLAETTHKVRPESGLNYLDKDAPRPGAVVAVHVYGRRCDLGDAYLGGLGKSAAVLGTPIAEDLAEAHGVRPHHDTAAACWSFYKNKIVAGEEGGAVWFRDPGRAAVARELRNMGFGPRHDYAHRPRCWNHRLADCLAERVLDSLGRYDENLAARWQAYGWYDGGCPEEWRMPKPDAPWVYSLRIPGLTRRRMLEVVGALNAEDIQARCGFLPMSCQEEFQDCRRVDGRVAFAASQEVFYCPLTPGQVTRESARRAFEVIRRHVG